MVLQIDSMLGADEDVFLVEGGGLITWVSSLSKESLSWAGEILWRFRTELVAGPDCWNTSIPVPTGSSH